MAPAAHSTPPPVQTNLLSSTPLSALKTGAANDLGASKSAIGLAINKPFHAVASRSALVSFSVPNDPKAGLWKSLAGEVMKVPLTSHPPTDHLKHTLSTDRVSSRDSALALTGASSRLSGPSSVDARFDGHGANNFVGFVPAGKSKIHRGDTNFASLFKERSQGRMLISGKGFHSKQASGVNEGFVFAGKFDCGVSMLQCCLSFGKIWVLLG
ncbi:hypothetical protein SUGI_0973410 [Cryptomeria japonica]|nr:hypothetical protein SUGI_0973410 [Cryptomeria japonica]